MAKDDYEVLVYKILICLYGYLKRVNVYESTVFDKVTGKDKVDDQYFADVLRMMQNDGLIEGGTWTKAWGSTYVMASDISDIKITSAGISYLKENSRMQMVKRALIEAADILAELIIKLAL